jgi:hypothetical protein
MSYRESLCECDLCGHYLDGGEQLVCGTHLDKIERAAKELYLCGHWVCSGIDVARQGELWEALRDALGIERGTATKAGV